VIERLVQWITPVFADWGLPLIFLATFLETSAFLGLLVPGETVVILGGILANATFRAALGAPSNLDVTIGQVIAVTIAGVVAGDNAGYLIGRFGGRRLFDREGGRLFNRERLAAAEDYYRRHGGKTIFLGRFTPFLRSFGALVAGASKMRYPRFVAWDLAGALLWGVGIPLIGYTFGRYGTSSIKAIDRALKAPGLLILLVIVVVAIVYLRRRRRTPRPPAEAPPGAPTTTDSSG
jgi:membrane protein DedA with SNARE-associated domain